MADWRTTGVVADSEEEEDLSDDELDQQPPKRNEPAQRSIPQKTGRVLDIDEEFDSGLRQEEDQLGNGCEQDSVRYSQCNGAVELRSSQSENGLPSPKTLVNSQNGHFGNQGKTTASSVASSPLSEVPDEIEELPSLYFPLVAQETTKSQTLPDISLGPTKHNDGAQARREELREYIDVDGLDDYQVAIELSQRRNLRKRNPIQLHPYLLEGERYRKTMKARGVRPIHLAQNDSNRATSPAVNSSDRDDDFQLDLNTSSPVEQHRSPTASQQQTSSPREELGEPSTLNGHLRLNSDDDLPDIPSILDRQVSKSVRHSHKRRKLAHIAIPSTVQQIDRLTTASQQLLPSPPTSSQSPPRRDAQLEALRFRVPRSLQILPTLTPAQSSDISLQHASSILSDQEQTSEVDLTPGATLSSRRRAIVVSSDEESKDRDSSPDESVELQRFQKRIKGVLPASWLKLDKQSRQARIAQPLTKPSRAKSPPHQIDGQRGIARKRMKPPKPVSTPGQPSPPIRTAWGVEDEIDQVSEDGAFRHAAESDISPKSGGKAIQREFDDAIDLSDMEDSTLDPMLPGGAPRQRRTQGGPYKRQSRLTETFQPQKPPGYRSKAAESSRTQSEPREHRVSTKPRAVKKKQSRLPRLSILDVPISPTQACQQLPQFLRLAARNARKSRTQGKQSAHRKFIRLQTIQDSEDANQILRAWRAGTIVPEPNNSKLAPPPRKPLQERPDNLQMSVTQRRDRHGGQESRESVSALQDLISNAKARPQQQKLRPVKSVELDPENELPTLSAQKTVGHELLQHSRSRQQSRPVQHGPRAAQLETLEEDYDEAFPETAFRRKLLRLGRPEPPVPIENNVSNPRPAVPVKPKPRKQIPKRLDVEMRRYRQPAEPLPEYCGDLSLEEAATDFDQSPDGPLEGLGPYGTVYATDFDVLPLQIGTYFHQETFIGSGSFADSLASRNRDLDISAPPTVICFKEHLWHWSCWDSQLETQLETIISALIDDIDRLANPATSSLSASLDSLECIIRWKSKSLFFLDPVDRRSFVRKTLRLLSTLQNSVATSIKASPPTTLSDWNSSSNSLLVRWMCRIVVLANQLMNISNHKLVEDKMGNDVYMLLVESCKYLVRLFLSRGMSFLQEFQEQNRQHLLRDAGIRKHDLTPEVITIVDQVVRRWGQDRITLWDMVNDYFAQVVAGSNRIQTFDRAWYALFTLLPMSELDEHGLLLPGSRFRFQTEGWNVVKMLLSRLFKLMRNSKSSLGSTGNSYVRAVFARCYNLMHLWGWRKCDSVLGCIFDFFAQQRLAPLRHEETTGSPRFLEQLDGAPDIPLQRGDTSMHIFLKMLALGIRNMRTVYNEKKLRGIVYRFIPVHGRVHSKENDLRQEDLNALRNHVDILSTLYWAAPASCRPRIEAISELIDLSNSHTEVCRLSYQLSTDESASNLDPFAKWHHEIIRVNLDQYRLARSEAEAHSRQMSFEDASELSSSFLESAISSNQRKLVAVIRDALSSLASAVRLNRCMDNVQYLLQKSSVFDLLSTASFQSTARLLNPIVTDCLEIASVYLEQLVPGDASVIQQASEESQEYGDWSGFESLDVNTGSAPKPNLLFVTEPLTNLVSNAFGAEEPPDDNLLMKSVNVFVLAANHLVRQGEKDWTAYIGPYGLWTQLRETEQKRRYTPCFLGQIVRSCPTCLEEHSTSFKTIWVESLVERQSLLRFQNELTSALLNAKSSDPLFYNMPFASNPEHYYEITPAIFRERRLSIITTVLSNIRQIFENPEYASDGRIDGRSEYIILLRRIQTTMKKNHQELDSASSTSFNPLSTKGAYVTFVQEVVSLLQEHTSEICPVDRFFTDSSAFPLPAADPTYVTSRLKSYALRLHIKDQKMMKQLVTFVITSSERAALDNQQDYLVDQLRLAMGDAYESGQDHQRPTLRRVTLLGILPAYVEKAFNSASGTLVAKPLVEAAAFALRDLMFQFSILDQSSISAVIELCKHLLGFLWKSTQAVTENETVLDRSHTRTALRLVLEIVHAAMPLVHYLCRVSNEATRALEFVMRFVAVASRTAHLTGRAEAHRPDEPSLTTNCCREDDFKDVRAYCASELSKIFESRWSSKDDGTCWIVRGGAWQQIDLSLGSEEEERMQFLETCEALRSTAQTLWGEPTKKRASSNLGHIMI
ncbi:MAG: hypothetical protein M1820_004465 [Bogoriella megaspora]|nr:MAG: hypothetical protein M1820_004465 [Bogoriella megaspora]